MKNILVFPAGTTEAIRFAEKRLRDSGVTTVDHPTPEVTHVLLDVPTKEIPYSLLERLPERVAVAGGNLILPGYSILDFLKTESYLAKNAAITAECAVRVAAAEMKRILDRSDVLVIGWGRIGKCLASLLIHIGCKVTVAARKESDRAMLQALGYKAADIFEKGIRRDFDLIFNTVPAPVAYDGRCPLKIDLASCQGLEGADVIRARGLPGKYAPESSGNLIADIFVKEVLV